MSYAVSADGSSWRSIAEESDLLPGEVFSAGVPSQSVPVMRAQLLQAVNTERARHWRGGFPVQVGGVTKWFHSDEFSLSQQLGLKDSARDLLAAGGVMSDALTIAGQPVVWSTLDKSTVAITAQVAFDIVAAAKVQQAAIFAASRAHADAISAAQNLDGYDVSANWPAIFGE